MLALTTAAKGGATAELDETRWEEDMRAALRITSSEVRRVAIASLMKSRFPETATITEPATGQGAAAGENVSTNDQGLDDAAMYALALIGESGPDSGPPGGDSNPSLADLEAIAAATATSAELFALEAEMRPAP